MALIDDIRDRYEGRRKEIDVPEWGCVIHSKPFTIADAKRVSRWVEKGDLEGNAEIVVRKAESEAGELMFHPSQRVELIRIADASIVNRIANEIVDSSPTVEEAEGN